jgi:hypothetical protein
MSNIVCIVTSCSDALALVPYLYGSLYQPACLESTVEYKARNSST